MPKRLATRTGRGCRGVQVSVVVALLFAAASGPGCSEGDKFTDPGNPPVVTSVVVTDGTDAKTYFKYGQTVHFELRMTNTTTGRLIVTLMRPPCIYTVRSSQRQVWSDEHPSGGDGWYLVRLSSRDTDSVTLSWDQLDDGGNWVGHGTYSVSVDIRESLVNDSRFTRPAPATFTIGP